MNAPPAGATRSHSIGIAYLLERLEGVKMVGRGWRARCPACGGVALKLAASVCDAGVEMHCWGGCSDEAVLSALLVGAVAPGARDLAPLSGLDTILLETYIAWIAAGEVLEGKPVSVGDFERLRVARVRLRHEIARMKALRREQRMTGGTP